MATTTITEISAELIEHPDILKFRSQTIDDEFKDFSWIKPLGYALTSNYVHWHDTVQNFEVFDDDVWVATYPKCGTRWMQELVWCLRNGIEEAKKISLPKRVPFFEFNVIDNKKINKTDSFEAVKDLSRPRTIKTHFAYNMLPSQLLGHKSAKIINVTRNPRDVCLSLFNHFQILEKYTGDLQTIVNILTNDIGFSWGPYFKNVLSYWNQRSQDNLLIVSYEDMQADLPAVIQNVADFLNIKITPDGVDELADHLSFDSMKANKMTNLETEIQKTEKIGVLDSSKSMMNKGKSGRWKEMLSEEMKKQFEEWEAKWLKDSDLKIRFDA